MAKFQPYPRGIAFLVGLIALAAAVSSEATVTYTYVGSPFALASPPFTTEDRIAGQFTVDMLISTGGSGIVVTPLIRTFSFSDGVSTASPDLFTNFVLFQD